MVRDTLTLDESAKINVRGLNIWYDDHHAIIDADLQIRKNNVTALIGPSGCGPHIPHSQWFQTRSCNGWQHGAKLLNVPWNAWLSNQTGD